MSMEAGLAGDAVPTPEQTARVLAERARALAVPVEAEPDGDVVEMMVFELAGERYALETRFAIEVRIHAETAYLPGAEPPLVGITAWRGELLPLLDLRSILRLPDDGAGGLAQLLVLGESRAAFGVLVDSVLELRDVPVSAVGPLPGGGAGGRGFLRGVMDDAVLVLAAGELLHSHSAGAGS